MPAVCCTSRRSACAGSEGPRPRAPAARARALRPRRDPRARRRAGRGPRRSTTCAAARERLMRIGTRRSALALAQAEHVAGLLGGAELVGRHDGRRPRPRRSERQVALGDRARARRCSRARSTSRCTRPRTCPPSCAEGLAMPASRRARGPRDVLCGADGLAAPAGRRVGTASCAGRPAARGAPDLEVVDARQRRHAAGEARRRRVPTRSCSPPPACAAGARASAGRCSTRARARARAGRARARGRPATSRCVRPSRRSTTRPRSPACSPSARSCAR